MTLQALERSWQEKAACRGPLSEVFFPPPRFERKEAKLRRERKAKEICSACSVKSACLDYAITVQEPYGVWGGLSENERKQLFVGVTN